MHESRRGPRSRPTLRTAVSNAYPKKASSRKTAGGCDSIADCGRTLCQFRHSESEFEVSGSTVGRCDTVRAGLADTNKNKQESRYGQESVASGPVSECVAQREGAGLDL